MSLSDHCQLSDHFTIPSPFARHQVESSNEFTRCTEVNVFNSKYWNHGEAYNLDGGCATGGYGVWLGQFYVKEGADKAAKGTVHYSTTLPNGPNNNPLCYQVWGTQTQDNLYITQQQHLSRSYWKHATCASLGYKQAFQPAYNLCGTDKNYQVNTQLFFKPNYESDLTIGQSNPVTKALATAIVAGFSNDQVVQFVTGLLDGLVQDNNFDAIKPCLGDAEALQVELTEAVGDFKKKDIMDIVKGVSVVGKMIGTIDTDLQDCKGVQPDIKRIQVWAAIFKHPIALFTKVFQNTMMNMDKIEGDIMTVVMDAQTNDLHDMGEQIADILVTQLGPIPKIEEIEIYQQAQDYLY